MMSRLGHDCFLQVNFLFIIYPSSCYETLQNADSESFVNNDKYNIHSPICNIPRTENGVCILHTSAGHFYFCFYLNEGISTLSSVCIYCYIRSITLSDSCSRGKRFESLPVCLLSCLKFSVNFPSFPGEWGHAVA